MSETPTESAIRAMPAGRELDAAVHRLVCGRECAWFFPTPGEFGSDLDGLYETPLRVSRIPQPVPSYSSSWLAAGPLLESCPMEWNVDSLSPRINLRGTDSVMVGSVPFDRTKPNDLCRAIAAARILAVLANRQQPGEGA